MSPYPHPIIAREGWVHITVAFLISLFVHLFLGWLWALPFWLIALFVLQFFRDPPRIIPLQANAILAPADGRIVAVEKTQDPFLNREAIKVSVFMNVFNVHSNRSPVDGEVKDRWYFPGKFINASLPKASLENERNALWIKTGRGLDVTCVQIAGLIAKRIICHAKPGDHLSRGQRFGFIRFGSRVDVYLPTDTKINVNIGDKVYATLTILAELRS
ncbi:MULTISPECIES: phosphatidylserine decarboxylase [unclassified Nitrosomonas]|uniref:phosphatidylserine decarboxylase n=1 Tax=unclassified Nitrosomonas TaxID=2609265 RepID=UPI000895D429|nr:MULTISPECIES: phosphatidylserine decarboxylase [unclassified Nitrosomonas]MDV6344434.1 phosphatidylserine decarboxylase [Nitrosomonas sp. Is37]SDX96116.1 phosphatidylserine decarboxylase [Nitrosomonas sp. Nm33]